MMHSNQLWEYTLPPTDHMHFRSTPDPMMRMCCTLCGLLAIFVILATSSRPTTRFHDYRNKMVPVFVSSMKTAFSTIQNKFSTPVKQISAKIAEVDKTEKVDVFSKTANDDVLTNLTPCGKGETCMEEEIEDAEKKKNDEKVKEYLAQNPNHVMFIFAPWCGHCKTAMPEFCAARKETSTPLAIVNSNMVSRDLLSTEFNVTHFPFIIKKTENSNEVFKGKAIKENLVDFAKKSDLQMMFM